MYDLISVIIPIYRVELYLKECIDSVLNQTYKNIEIILVDDGSDDNCPNICDAYKKRDSRIQVIHKKNGGLSDARNAGIEIAKGEYICFIDSDDAIHPSFLQILYEDLIETGSDMSICHYEKVDKIPEIYKTISASKKVYTKEEIESCLYGKESLEIIVAWNKLYRKSIWDYLRYPKGKVHEDEFVIHHILNQVNRVVINQGAYYYYRQREGSITKQYNEKRLHALEALQERFQFYLKKNKTLAYQTMYQYFFAITTHIQQINNQKQYLEIKNGLKKEMNVAWKTLICKKEIPFLKKIKMCYYWLKYKYL